MTKVITTLDNQIVAIINDDDSGDLVASDMCLKIYESEEEVEMIEREDGTYLRERILISL